MEIDQSDHSKSESSEDEEGIYPISEIQSHNDSVCSVSWHPTSSEIFASGGVDDTGFLYRQDSVKELSGHTDSVISVQFSPCGEYLALGSMDGNVSVFLVSTSEQVAKYSGPTEEVLSLSWHPRVLSLLVLSSDLSMWIWHLKKPSPVAVMYGHPLNLAKFAPTGRFIYAGGSDGSVKVWDMKSEGFQNSPPFYTAQQGSLHNDEVISVDMHESGIVVSGAKDGSIGLTNPGSGKVLGKISLGSESVEAVQFCLEMVWFLAASVDGDLKVFDCDTLSPRVHVQLGKAIVKSIWRKFHIFVCGTEGLLECLDGRSGEKLFSYKGCSETYLDLDVNQ
jgi:ribosome assembly protein SQT1